MKKEEPEETIEENTVLLTEIRDLLREKINIFYRQRLKIFSLCLFYVIYIANT